MPCVIDLIRLGTHTTGVSLGGLSIRGFGKGGEITS